MSSDDQNFTADLPPTAQPDWTPDNADKDAPELMHALEDGMLTIANPEGGTLGRWIRSDYFVEVDRDE